MQSASENPQQAPANVTQLSKRVASPSRARALATKHRQVRFSYPEPLIALVQMLLTQHTGLVVAKMLQLSTSTIYRWARSARDSAAIERAEHDGRSLQQLLAACEHYGFHIAPAVLGSDTDDTDSNQVSQSDGAQPGLPSLATTAPSGTLTGGDADIGVHFSRLEPLDQDNVHITGKSRLTCMEAANAHIHARYYTKLSCAELARISGITRTHFVKVYKQVYGVTPYRRISEVRIAHAKDLLRNTSQSLDLVAVAVGFDTLSSLCRSFKKIEGISVSQFYSGLRLPSAGMRNSGMRSDSQRMSA